MAQRQWRKYDLNLLVTFVTLMETRSVTRAAERLSLGQSAMSHSLSRLRTMLDDPLFERRGHQMVPTARALDIAPKVEALLATLATDVLTSPQFDPTSFDGQIRLGLTDYAELIFAPSLFDTLNQQLPMAQLSLRPVDRQHCLSALKNDDVDAVIGVIPDDSGLLDSKVLYREQHVCLFDPHSTGLTPPINLVDFISTPHALVSANGKLSSPIDTTLSEQGYHRHIVMGSQRFLTVRQLLKGRQLLCTVPELMARLDTFNDAHDLTFSQPPIDVPGFDIGLAWRRQASGDPKIKWLTTQITAIISQRVSVLKAQKK
ncbi:LysR family transcriptional regulator [Salinivibrio sp. ES.052]|uniref:LysR family transcriptional regulator n=1 Tax=Salinivibrio sp. ES.052 TaxID=1882823 RepID=UPI0009262B21|nr:LysR family transcriptional regulator [Salinivibrio sp. ES.052]SIO03481.1 DNA-binding transcriptional regulator, LysR family [Salinivibrio sp. ES.052]